MSMFAQVTMPSRPKSKEAPRVALLYAGILVLLAVAQLFSFEKFIPLIESFGLGGGHGTAVLVACVIVVSEVFALPFLLRMPLSPLMRWTSMALGWLVAAVWVGLAVWANVYVGAGENMGFLGASIRLPSGWWSVLVGMALFVLAIWASWGMWPEASRRRTKQANY